MSLRVGILGDLHLGRSLYGYDLSPQIRESMYSFFRACVKYKAGYAVQVGDVFDSPRPTQRNEKILIQWANEFERAELPLYILAGNHDVTSRPGMYSALDVLKAFRFRFVRVVDRPVYAKGEGVTGFVFLPFPSPSIYAEPHEWIDDIDAATNAIKGQAIVFCHLNIDGAKLGDQEWVYRGGDYVLPPGLARDPRTLLCIGGHVHKYQQTHDDVLIVGAANPLRFNEDNKCRSVFVTVDKGKEPKITTRASATIKLMQVDVDAAGITDTAEVIAGLPEDVSDRIVKVQPYVSEETGIAWDQVEQTFYARNAKHVILSTPILSSKRPRQTLKKSTVGEPVKAVKFFLRTRIENVDERKAIYRAFREVDREVSENG